MHKLFALFLLLALSACQTKPCDCKADKESRKPSSEGGLTPEQKQHFKNLSAEERQSYLKIAKVQNPQWRADLVMNVDILKEVKERCGPLFPYTKDAKGNFTWPTITCNYTPDTEADLSGMSPKFNCRLPNGKKYKIKYSYNNEPMKNTEPFDAVAATNMARLLGFEANDYCPAQISCVGCPSQTPWNDARASAPASQQTYNFRYAVVETKTKGVAMTNPGPHPKPQGLEWAELKLTSANWDEKEKAQELALREAWMLWVQVLHHTDADAHNQRLICTTVETTPELFCSEAYAYTNDYGNSFERMSYLKYSTFDPVFTRSSKGCMTAMDKGEGLIRKAVISEEARKLLAERTQLISDAQLVDIWNLTQIESVTGKSAVKWAAVMRKKFQEVIDQTSCESLSSHNTVLTR